MTLGKFWSSLCQVFVHISVVLCLCLHSFCLRACFSKSDKVFIMWVAKYVPNGDLTRGATETGGCWDLLLCNTRVGQVTTRQPWPPFRDGCGRAGLCFPLPQRSPFAWLGWRLLAGSAAVSSTAQSLPSPKISTNCSRCRGWDCSPCSAKAAAGAGSLGRLMVGRALGSSHLAPLLGAAL